MKHATGSRFHMASKLFNYHLNGYKQSIFSIKTMMDTVFTRTKQYSNVFDGNSRSLPLEFSKLGPLSGGTWFAYFLRNNPGCTADLIMEASSFVDSCKAVHSAAPMAYCSSIKAATSNAAFKACDYSSNVRFTPTPSLIDNFMCLAGNEEMQGTCTFLAQTSKDFLKYTKECELETYSGDFPEESVIEVDLAEFYAHALRDSREQGRILFPVRNAWKLSSFLANRSDRQYYSAHATYLLNKNQDKLYSAVKDIVTTRNSLAKQCGFRSFNAARDGGSLRTRPEALKFGVPKHMMHQSSFSSSTDPKVLSGQDAVLKDIHERVRSSLETKAGQIAAAARNAAGDDAESNLRLSLADMCAMAPHAQGLLSVPRIIVNKVLSSDKDSSEGTRKVGLGSGIDSQFSKRDIVSRCVSIWGKLHGFQISDLTQSTDSASQSPLMSSLPHGALCFKVELKNKTPHAKNAVSNAQFLYVLPSKETQEAPLPPSSMSRLLVDGHVAVSSSLVMPEGNNLHEKLPFTYPDVVSLFASLGAARAFMHRLHDPMSRLRHSLIAEDSVSAAFIAHELVAVSPTFWKVLLPFASKDLAALPTQPALVSFLDVAVSLANSATDRELYSSRLDRLMPDDLAASLRAEMQVWLPFTLPQHFDAISILRNSFSPSRALAPGQQRLLGLVDGAWWAEAAVKGMENKHRLGITPSGGVVWGDEVGKVVGEVEELSLEDKIAALDRLMFSDYGANLQTMESILASERGDKKINEKENELMIGRRHINGRGGAFGHQ